MQINSLFFMGVCGAMRWDPENEVGLWRKQFFAHRSLPALPIATDWAASIFQHLNNIHAPKDGPSCQDRLIRFVSVRKIVTYLYFLPSTLVTLWIWIGVIFGVGLFFEVGERDIGVPPVGHGVVEDPVEGGKVCRGGEGGAAVVVARCLSPNNSPHLLMIGGR